MLVVVCYDVATDATGARRLRRIAEACKDFGVRVSNRPTSAIVTVLMPAAIPP